MRPPACASSPSTEFLLDYRKSCRAPSGCVSHKQGAAPAARAGIRPGSVAECLGRQLPCPQHRPKRCAPPAAASASSAAARRSAAFPLSVWPRCLQRSSAGCAQAPTAGPGTAAALHGSATALQRGRPNHAQQNGRACAQAEAGNADRGAGSDRPRAALAGPSGFSCKHAAALCRVLGLGKMPGPSPDSFTGLTGLPSDSGPLLSGFNMLLLHAHLECP